MKKLSVKSIKLNQTVVNTIVIVVICSLFVYFGVQLSRGFFNSVTTQRTQVITDVDYLHLRGYVFRSESVIERPGEGVCHYLVEDGQRVRKDQEYYTFYSLKGAEEKQDQLDELSRQIALLNSKVAMGGTVSDLSHINESLSSSYYSYIDSVLDGNFSAADRVGETLLSSIVNYSVITAGRDDVVKNVIEPLEKTKKELLASLGNGRTVSADEGGFYFFHGVDGYEDIFSSNRLESLTCEELDRLISSSPKKYDTEPIGKTASVAEWFLVMPVDGETIMRFAYPAPEVEEETESGDGNIEAEPYEPVFRIGQSYKVTFTEGGREISMKLDDVRFEDDGEGYLVFSSYDLILSSELSRAQDVKINMASTTGYRIPSDALVENDGESGVYILVGTVVEFRRVTVIGKGNGYYIVNTYEKDRSEIEAAGTTDKKRPDYLYVNDLIITSANDLYDGKLLD